MSTTQETLDTILKEHYCILPSSLRKVVLRKVTVRTLRPVVALMSRVLASVKEQFPEGTLANLESSGVGSPDVILKLISTHYEEVIELLPLFCDLSTQEILDLDPGDAITAIQAVILLNKDFFTKTVLPALDLSKAAMAAPGA